MVLVLVGTFWLGVRMLLLLHMRVLLPTDGPSLIFLFLLAFVLMPGWLMFLARLPVSLSGLLVGWIFLIGLLRHRLVLFRMSGTFIGMSLELCLMMLSVPLGMLHPGLLLMNSGPFGVEVLKLAYCELTPWLEVL